MSKKEIWVFAEQNNASVVSVFCELLSKANEIAAKKNWQVASVIIGNDTDKAVELLKESSEKIYVADHAKLENYTLEAYASVFEHMVRTYAPEMILVGATGIGAELAPTLAAKVKTGLAAHCIDIRVDNEKDRMNCMVPAFGGRVVSEIYIPETRPIMATIRPGILEKTECRTACKEVVNVDVSYIDTCDFGEEFLEFIPIEHKGIKVEDANVVVAVGRGVSTEQAWNDANEISAKLGGAVGWTRSFIDYGIVNNESNMIGTSGKSVKPKVFIGAGISGATHFVCGMEKSKLIINVNKDEKAKIFRHSDYGIVGDAKKFLNALNEKLK